MDKLKSTLAQLAIDHADDTRRMKEQKEQLQFWYDFVVWLQEEIHLPIEQLIEKFKESYYEK